MPDWPCSTNEFNHCDGFNHCNGWNDCNDFDNFNHPPRENFMRYLAFVLPSAA